MTPTANTRPPMPDTMPKHEIAPVHWDPNMPWPADRHLVLTARSFQSWTDSSTPKAALSLVPVQHVTECDKLNVDHVLIGKRKLYRRTFEPYYWHEKQPFMGFSMEAWAESRRPTGWYRSGLDLLKQGRRWGNVSFDAPVNIPILTDAEGKPWMSLTPSEIFTLRPGIRHARGTVMVGGLGMGWLAQQIRLKKGVKKVLVAENDYDVATFFGKALAKMPGAPVEVMCGDFYRLTEERKPEINSIVADIWKDFADAPYDRNFQALKEDFKGPVWGWGDYARSH